MARVLVAMSGGVDSSVAAARLVEQGHDVTGVHLRLADVPRARQVPGQGCCSLDDAQDARRAAQVLGVPFYVWDLTDAFAAHVQEPFERAYAAGRTPNPCVACNQRVKYRALLDRARRLGFDALATGHHARLRRPVDGRLVPLVDPGPGARLLRAADPAKDQSYVLYMARPDELAHSLFPVGELTKSEVRSEARRRGLRVADKPDSHDVCFIPDGDTGGYLGDRLPDADGPIVDLDGTVLGSHRGVWGYTIGQRRGLGLDHHERRYVVALDAERNRVVVGPRSALQCRWLRVGDLSATRRPHPAAPDPGPVRVQIRAHAATVPGVLRPGRDADQGRRIDLDEPLQAVAPGQAAVLYDTDDRECLGGGRIVAAERPAAVAVR